MSSLHICFVSQEYPPDTGWGGIASYTYEMAHGLVAAGHQVSVIACALDRDQVVNDAGVAVHRVLPGPDWGRIRGFWRLGRVWPGFAWSAMKRFRSIHRERAIDLVEGAEIRGDTSFIAQLRRRPPVIVRLHTAWVFVDRLNQVHFELKKRWTYQLERQAIHSADAITSPSQGMVDLTSTWVSLARHPIAVVPNPVNTSTFSPGPGGRSGEVLFAGRLERRKGIETLIEAMPEVLRRSPEASFRFVGGDGVDASGRSWRELLLAEVPNGDHARVHFEQLPRDAILSRYRTADLCVLPSIWENFPYVLLEAMACGTPVVATATGGLPEMVEDGVSGLLVPPESPNELADAISDLLMNSTRREDMGRNAQQRVVECFSTERVVPRMVETYCRVLETYRR